MSMFRQMIFLETFQQGEETVKIALYEKQGEYKVVRNSVQPGEGEQNELLYSGAHLSMAYGRAGQEKRLLRFTGYTSFFDRAENRTKTEWNQDMIELSQEYANHDILRRLKNWRQDKAALLNVAPYMVLEDKVLQLLSTFVPQTKAQFMMIPHFAEKRWEQYGEELLDLLKGCEASLAIPEQLASSEQAKPKSSKKERQIRLLTLIQEEKPEFTELARLLEVSVNTTADYLEGLLEEGYDVDGYIEYAARNIPFDKIEEAISSVGSTDRLKPIFVELNGEVPAQEASISYADIRLALVRRKAACGR